MNRHHKGFIAAVAAVASLAAAGAASAGAPAPGPGNSSAAKACQNGGWQNLVTQTGDSFADQGACTSYVAQGGTLAPKPTQQRWNEACEAGSGQVESAGIGGIWWCAYSSPLYVPLDESTLDALQPICDTQGWVTTTEPHPDGGYYDIFCALPGKV